MFQHVEAAPKRGRLTSTARRLLVIGLLALSGAATSPSRAEVVGDPDAGRRVFSACRSCHDVGQGAVHRTGPQLNGLFGRQAGALEDYPFSLPMVSAGLHGLVWTEETLEIYLIAPQESVPGTSMPHVGVREAQDRADLIAFLRRAAEPGAEEQARPRVKTAD